MIEFLGGSFLGMILGGIFGATVGAGSINVDSPFVAREGGTIPGMIGGVIGGVIGGADWEGYLFSVIWGGLAGRFCGQIVRAIAGKRVASPSEIISSKNIISRYKAGERSFRNIKLDEADLDLSHSHLPSTDLRDADLRGADLRYADLSGANLRGAVLSEAGLNGANLEGADLSGANLSWAYLESARYNSDTIWPDGFDPEKFGAVKE